MAKHAGTKKNRKTTSDKFNSDWNLDWFEPTVKQQEALDKFDNSVFNILDCSSGTGKTTLALWYAFSKYRTGDFEKIIFMKTPAESGSDELGLLSGDAENKLVAHMQITRMIMWDFISKNKLECDERNGNIRITIPNYELGATYDNSIVLMDESQLYKPSTMKFITERCGVNSKYIIMGDSKQRYAVKDRQDGLSDFIVRMTEAIPDSRERTPKRKDMCSYTKLTYLDNMRSEGSAYITEVYDD